MAAPAPARRAWTANRVLLVVAAACFLVAAVSVAFPVAVDLGPAWAWAFGGFSAWALSGAV